MTNLQPSSLMIDRAEILDGTWSLAAICPEIDDTIAAETEAGRATGSWTGRAPHTVGIVHAHLDVIAMVDPTRRDDHETAIDVLKKTNDRIVPVLHETKTHANAGAVVLLKREIKNARGEPKAYRHSERKLSLFVV